MPSCICLKIFWSISDVINTGALVRQVCYFKPLQKHQSRALPPDVGNPYSGDINEDPASGGLRFSVALPVHYRIQGQQRENGIREPSRPSPGTVERNSREPGSRSPRRGRYWHWLRWPAVAVVVTANRKRQVRHQALAIAGFYKYVLLGRQRQAFKAFIGQISERSALGKVLPY